MTAKPLQVEDNIVIECQHFGQLFKALKNCGYNIIGPTIRDGAILYDSLNSIDDLPSGWTDEQEAAEYRLAPSKDEAPSSYVSGGRVYFTITTLARRKSEALFGYAVSPHSWKRYLHPATQRLWKAKRNGDDFEVEEEKRENNQICIYWSQVLRSPRHRGTGQDFMEASMSTSITRPAGRMHSFWQLTAARPAARVFAPRWEPAQRRHPVLTWHSRKF